MVGTTTDTKERGDDGRYRLRPVGWVVTAAIGLALVVGALGQYYEDKQQEVAEAKQMERLQDIAELAQKSLKPFSGRVDVAVMFSFPVDQPQLKAWADFYEESWTPQMAERSGMPDDNFALTRLLGFPEVVAVEEAFQEQFRHVRCYITTEIARPPDQEPQNLVMVTAMVASLRDVRIIGYRRKSGKSSLSSA